MRRKDKDKIYEKEFELFESIEKFIKDNNYSPSYRELLDMNIYTSLSTIQEKLLKFEDLELIEIAKDKKGRIKSRTIRLLCDAKDIKKEGVLNE